MKLIPLTQGKFAKVDDEDFEWLSASRWMIKKGRAAKNGRGETGRTTIYMHRLLMNCPDSLEIDHIDGDPTNNQKENLRICSGRDNKNNIHGKKWKKGEQGLTKRGNKWVARITHNQKIKYLGAFCNKEDAANAYKKASIELFGDFSPFAKESA